MAERFGRIEEARGSIPLTSTKAIMFTHPPASTLVGCGRR